MSPSPTSASAADKTASAADSFFTATLEQADPEIAAAIESAILAKHGVNRTGLELAPAAAAAGGSTEAPPAPASRGKRGPAPADARA